MVSLIIVITCSRWRPDSMFGLVIIMDIKVEAK